MPATDADCLDPDRLLHSLRRVLEKPGPPDFPPAALDACPELAALLTDLHQLREFALRVSQGDLSRKLAMKGVMAGALKTLQANLAHLTWQTKMIASGDLTQRVEFLGEFSRAFNSMVATLDENRRRLALQEAELREANQRLKNEIVQKDKAQAKLLRTKQRYRTMAMRDALSGLYNRRFFFLLGKREVSRAARNGSPLACILFDLDHFKQLNDSLGHAAGDEAIRAVGGVTRHNVRDIDLAARYGGEEFVVLLPDCPLDHAVHVAQRLRQSIESHRFDHCGQPARLTASFGAAVLHQEPAAHRRQPAKLDALVDRADRALYLAKAEGRNRVVAL